MHASPVGNPHVEFGGVLGLPPGGSWVVGFRDLTWASSCLLPDGPTSRDALGAARVTPSGQAGEQVVPFGSGGGSVCAGVWTPF